jgi:hypothetical protein
MRYLRLPPQQQRLVERSSVLLFYVCTLSVLFISICDLFCIQTKTRRNFMFIQDVFIARTGKVNLHAAESFLRSLPVCSWSRNFPHFTEPQGSLPHSQVPATCPYPEPAQSSPYPPSPSLKFHGNTIFPSTSWSPHWSLSLRFPHQNPVHTCPLLHTRYMPRSSLLDFITSTIVGKQYRTGKFILQ